MSGETNTTVVGDLASDPELRHTPSGGAVASFAIASTPRTFDRASSQWKDAETLFRSCSSWNQAAENADDGLGSRKWHLDQGQDVAAESR